MPDPIRRRARLLALTFSLSSAAVLLGACVGVEGCPPGFWRGPWGHCRDTPYFYHEHYWRR